jgi:hypothetical protein
MRRWHRHDEPQFLEGDPVVNFRSFAQTLASDQRQSAIHPAAVVGSEGTDPGFLKIMRSPVPPADEPHCAAALLKLSSGMLVIQA